MTPEIMPERLALARSPVADAGLSPRIEFHPGDAHALFPSLLGLREIACLDADKGGDKDYFRKLFPGRLPSDRLLIAHNAVLMAEKMQSYLELVRQQPESETVIVRAAEDDGLALRHRTRTRT